MRAGRRSIASPPRFFMPGIYGRSTAFTARAFDKIKGIREGNHGQPKASRISKVSAAGISRAICEVTSLEERFFEKWYTELHKVRYLNEGSLEQREGGPVLTNANDGHTVRDCGKVCVGGFDEAEAEYAAPQRVKETRQKKGDQDAY